MKTRLFVTLFSLTVLMLAVTPVEAANSYDEDSNQTQVKADTKRVDKLRHGYITYNGNRMYYHW